MIVNSNNITLILDDVEVPTLTSVSLNVSREMVVVTTKPTNGYLERIPGQRDGNIDFEGYYDASNDRLEPGTLVGWRFRGDRGVFYGNGYIVSESITGGTDEAPVRSGSIETTGRINFEPITQEVLCINGVTLCIDGQELIANT